MTFSSSGAHESTRHEHCLDLDITDDDILEDNETYQIRINLQSGDSDIPVTILPHTTLVTIIDDDSKSYCTVDPTHVHVPVHPYNIVTVYMLAHAAVGIAPLVHTQSVTEGGSDQEVCFNVFGTSEIDFTYFFTLSPDSAQGKHEQLFIHMMSCVY